MKKWTNNIFKGLCLTSAIFVFQACYGTPQDFGQDIHVSGVVKSKKTGEPIEGIKISASSRYHTGQPSLDRYEYTDKSGKFSFHYYETDEIRILFEDSDSTDGREYTRKDTVFTVNNPEIVINIELEEQ